MKVTNNYDLPLVIVRAMERKDKLYNAGKVDASVTQLIQPVQISVLRRHHFKDLTRDISESFWALLGSSVHSMLELGKEDNQVVEERLFMTIDGFRMSGQLDLQTIEGNEIDIIDYKVTSVYSVTLQDEAKDEWKQQLNLQALLVEANKDKRVRSLHICAILRDWSGSEAKRSSSYPQSPIMMIPVPIWPKADQLEYVRDRIALFRQAEFDHAIGEKLHECSAEERWVRNERWAVMKGTNKRAVRVFDTSEAAEDYADNDRKVFHVVYRPGTSTRCGYCGVSEWCAQYAQIKKEEEEGLSVDIPSADEGSIT